MWPAAGSPSWGERQAVSVLSTIRREQVDKGGETWSAEMSPRFAGSDPRAVQTQGSPNLPTARLWDDGIIARKTTRAILASRNRVVRGDPHPETRLSGCFGVTRV